ncbi:MAG: hypothetical protein AB1710_06480 [Pseudomonadota bacterium]|jgi:cell division protein ZapB
MEAELKALEAKVAQIVQVCQHLRAENMQLRQQLATAQNENKVLNEKINTAKARLEILLNQIPESTE